MRSAPLRRKPVPKSARIAPIPIEALPRAGPCAGAVRASTAAAVQQLPFFAWPGGQNPGEVAIAGTTILALGGSIVAVQADSNEKARSVARICRMVGTPPVHHWSCARAPDGTEAHIYRSSIKVA
jgi:hypothetical protein